MEFNANSADSYNHLVTTICDDQICPQHISKGPMWLLRSNITMKTMNSISDKIYDVWGTVIDMSYRNSNTQFNIWMRKLIWRYKSEHFQNIGMVGGKEVFLESVKWNNEWRQNFILLPGIYKNEEIGLTFTLGINPSWRSTKYLLSANVTSFRNSHMHVHKHKFPSKAQSFLKYSPLSRRFSVSFSHSFSGSLILISPRMLSKLLTLSFPP